WTSILRQFRRAPFHSGREIERRRLRPISTSVRGEEIVLLLASGLEKHTALPVHFALSLAWIALTITGTIPHHTVTLDSYGRRWTERESYTDDERLSGF